MNKRRKRFYIGLVVFAAFAVFATFQWIKPMVIESQKEQAIELLEFEKYTDIEYVGSDGWSSKLEFRVVDEDGKSRTVHVQVGDNGIMSVGP